MTTHPSVIYLDDCIFPIAHERKPQNYKTVTQAMFQSNILHVMIQNSDDILMYSVCMVLPRALHVGLVIF